MVSNPDSRPKGPGQSTPQTSIPSKTTKRVEDEVAAGKRRAESRIDSMAQSMHDAVDLFDDENEQMLARCMDYAAGRLESVAKYLKDRSFRGLRDDAADVARSHSLAFLGLALVGGFAAGRFLRSSSHHQASLASDSRDDDHAELPFASYGPGTAPPLMKGPPPSVRAEGIRQDYPGSSGSGSAPYQPGGMP